MKQMRAAPHKTIVFQTTRPGRHQRHQVRTASEPFFESLPAPRFTNHRKAESPGMVYPRKLVDVTCAVAAPGIS